MPAQPPTGAPMEIFAEAADWLIVIGGSAMQSYGMDRMTFDCDCAILDRDDSRLRELLTKIGYVADPPQGSFSRYHHLARKRPVVDVMRANASTFSKLLAESRKVRILGFEVRVPAPMHLVSMKLHALKQQPDRKYKDWPDICHLLDQNRSEWTQSNSNNLLIATPRTNLPQNFAAAASMNPDSFDLDLPIDAPLPPPPVADPEALQKWQAEYLLEFYQSEHFGAWYARTSEEMHHAEPFVLHD